MYTQYLPYNPENPLIRKTKVNLMFTGNENLVDPGTVDDDARLNFIAGTVDNVIIIGTLTTAPQVALDDGTDGQTYTATKTLTSGVQGQSFALAADTQPYTLTANRGVRIRKVVLGVGVATTNRARTSGVATLTFSAAPTGAKVGSEVTVASVGGTGYNGVVILTAVTGTTVSYLSPGANESTATDTTGRVGAYTAIVTGVFV